MSKSERITASKETDSLDGNLMLLTDGRNSQGLPQASRSRQAPATRKDQVVVLLLSLGLLLLLTPLVWRLHQGPTDGIVLLALVVLPVVSIQALLIWSRHKPPSQKL